VGYGQMRIRSNKIDKNNEYCLQLINVGKSFGGIRANDSVYLDVKYGERVAILGPNGAGKTTLFNQISGEYFPTDGKIIMCGRDVTYMKNYDRVKLGLSRTFQITELFWDMSIIENVVLALMGIRSSKKFRLFSSLRSNTDLFKEAEELIAIVKLQDKKNELIKNLSYGDQRLVELALSLASKPKILCLDEPNAGLSLAESSTMVKVINNLDRSITILLIEHDIDLVFQVVDRIMVLHDGVPVVTDTKENIRNNKRVQEIYLGEDV